ncbi:MAG: glycoside hydrolase family 95 protein [Lachnospiraceae bacterium]|nr:glycoside hydrolase family 95 protein [Lachnospiraceae bacterium]
MDIRERHDEGKRNCTVLWYDQPATDWNEALPVGNGRIGGMVFGGIGCERIQVNEDTIWYGGSMDRNNPSAREKLPVIRELIRAGKIHEAERLCKQALSGTPSGMRIYQTLGDISVDYDLGGELSEGGVSGYERGLNVGEALGYTHFELDDTVYEREIFMSAPDDVCAMRLTARGKKKMNLEIMQSRHHIYEYSERASGDSIVLGGNLGRDGLDYAMMCKAASSDGKIEVIGECITVRDATEVCLYWSALTTYRLQVQIEGGGQSDSRQESLAKKNALREALAGKLAQAASRGYDELRRRHIDDYKSYFDRVSLILDTDGAAVSTAQRTTSQCLAGIAAGGTDLCLEQLYFNFGRYLLISCSRPGTLPATLQGLWNKDMEAPWDAKFTININTEMNYWPAEVCDLGECHLPLFDLLKRMLPNGRRTAEVMYGCRGFVAHHNTDIWGDTAPQDLWIPGSFWVMGGAWLCTHIWMHYEYTGDVEFLRGMFPVMREAAQFFLDFCIGHEIDGKTYLCTCPSVSPENTFILPGGEQGANSIGVTMDNQILRDLFSQCHRAAEVLGVSDELDRQIVEACGQLIPTRIGRDGRILEWCEEYKEKEPGHRHISHLYGLHPSDQITRDGTPELADAAERTLQKRLEGGGGHTGWSRAWIMNHYAKLWDGERAHEHLRQLFIKSTLPNLFDNHPPFQIDGNFGSVAAMVEMLVQSNADRIVLLPALPGAWRNGQITGVRVRGNARMDIAWRDGKLISARICSARDAVRRFVYDGRRAEAALRAGIWTEIIFS